MHTITVHIYSAANFPFVNHVNPLPDNEEIVSEKILKFYTLHSALQ